MKSSKQTKEEIALKAKELAREMKIERSIQNETNKRVAAQLDSLNLKLSEMYEKSRGKDHIIKGLGDTITIAGEALRHRDGTIAELQAMNEKIYKELREYQTQTAQFKETILELKSDIYCAMQVIGLATAKPVKEHTTTDMGVNTSNG